MSIENVLNYAYVPFYMIMHNYFIIVIPFFAPLRHYIIPINVYTFIDTSVNLWTKTLQSCWLKVWLTVKIRTTRVPQNAIVPVGRPRPYSIIILNMRFIPKASLRASSQITASSYILERHLWVKNSKPFPLPLLGRWLANKLTVLLRVCGNCLTVNTKHLWLYAMLDQRRRRWVDVV